MNGLKQRVVTLGNRLGERVWMISNRVDREGVCEWSQRVVTPGNRLRDRV